MNSPEPEDEEVLLVEEVVAEYAEEVAPVQRPRGCAVPQCAGHLEKKTILTFQQFMFQSHLCGEELTHWIVGDVLAQLVDPLDRTQVLQHLEPVQGKLIVKKPVAEEHGEADAEDVAELAEAEPEVVLGVLGPVVEEVLCDLGGLLGWVPLSPLVAPLHWHVVRFPLQDVVDQPVLKEPLPCRPGHKIVEKYHHR